MKVENVERTLVRHNRRCKKTLYFTSKKKRFRVNVENKNARRKNNIILSTIEEIVKTLDFDTISTMATKDEEDANSKEHSDDCLSESEMKTS